MARTIWKGHISFGLVNIPVGLYPATKRSGLSAQLIDERDSAPIGYRKINKNTGEEVPSEHIVRAYEHDDDELVVLTDEEIEEALVEATQTLDIIDFVEIADIDPVYYDKPYFLAPTGKGAKSFVLLREAMRSSGKAGIAKVVLRRRQHLAALVPRGCGIAVLLLRFAHELRDTEELNLPGNDFDELKISDKERTMADQLLASLESDWNPDRYSDDYFDAMLELIRQKAERGEVTEVQTKGDDAHGPENVVDLSELLKKSLDQAKKKSRG